jgi:hypothetical protein
MSKKFLLLAVILAAVCSISLSGQTKAKFVSQDGGFTIDLPKDGYQGVEPIGDLTSGAGSYAWVTDDGQFSVSYLEGAFSIQNADGSLAKLADVILNSPVNKQAKVLSLRSFVVDGYPVVELKIKRAGGSAINRLIMVKRRLYVLTADWIEGDGSAASNILDSFQLVDAKTQIARSPHISSPSVSVLSS